MKESWMKEAVLCAKEASESERGGPFGAVVVKEGKIVGRGGNSVVSSHDPTAHAEVNAIRDACRNLGDFSLEGCELYTSCEPCPMCLASIYWARIGKVYYACDRYDAAAIGFDDENFYEELSKPMNERSIVFEEVDKEEARAVMARWYENEERREY